MARHYRPAVDASANYADLVIDTRTGRVLHATSPDELRHPASLTKMMTLYLAFQALKSGQLRLDQYLPVSQNAAGQEPSKLGLRAGQQIRVEDALLGLVTKSANDATVVVAEALGGTEEQFARMMTNKARALGMSHTVFRNPSGLPNPEQVTTARDMAILGYALVYHHPQYYPYFSRDGFTYAGVHHHNHNHLMSRYRGMDGIKTGYIRASGFNLVASTVRGPTRLIGVVFGGHSAVARDNKMAALLDQAFAQLHNGQALQRMASADDGATDYVAVPEKEPTVLPVQHIAVASRGGL
ncbi:MAG: D-alanyl-D-alanine carboxypeptidase [Magnetococcales bacterium]|nr:D-alanyl-D-alanine carboxypeptidase [Magnetococcales bacterium]